MNPELYAQGISKGLEAWTLQNMVDASVIIAFLALGLMACRAYLDAYRDRMTLRLSVELWDIVIDLATDVLLFSATLIGLLTTNPDIMADVKIALPFLPLVSLLLGIALVIRAFYGGHRTLSKAWWTALAITAVAALVGWFGFTFVMEGATTEYFSAHYPAFWNVLHHMRSDLNRELALASFYWLGSGFVLLFGWAVVTGLRRTVSTARRRQRDSDRGS